MNTSDPLEQPDPRTRSPEEIAAANALFDSLSPEERRKAIAREVLNLLKSEKIHACRGVYLEDADFGYVRETVEEYVVADTQCECCAVGAATLAAVRLFNKGPSNFSYDMKDYLRNFFTASEVAQMENAFEGNAGNIPPFNMYDYLPLSERKRAAQMLRGLEADEALTAIFQQIADTGNFIVPSDVDVTSYEEEIDL